MPESKEREEERVEHDLRGCKAVSYWLIANNYWLRANSSTSTLIPLEALKEKSRKGTNFSHLMMESLILAQGKRWRRA